MCFVLDFSPKLLGNIKEALVWLWSHVLVGDIGSGVQGQPLLQMSLRPVWLLHGILTLKPTNQHQLCILDFFLRTMEVYPIMHPENVPFNLIQVSWLALKPRAVSLSSTSFIGTVKWLWGRLTVPKDTGPQASFQQSQLLSDPLRTGS